MSTAVGYIRRSTDSQDRSLNDQRAAIESFAATQRLSLASFYVDDAISGTSADARDNFLRMIEHSAMRPQPFEVVIVYDVTRFGRMDNDETGYYRHILRMNGVEVRYATEGFTGTSLDDLIRPVKQWQARQESKDLAKIVIRGKMSKFLAAKGCWMGGVPPFGYDRRYEDAHGKFLFIIRNMPDMTKQMLDGRGRLVRVIGPRERLSLTDRDRCRLLPSLPERVVIVRRVYDDFLERGLGCKMIADQLNHEGFATAFHSNWTDEGTRGTWGYGTIRCMLMNPAYAGDLVWNRRTAGKFFRIGADGAIERSTQAADRVRFNELRDWHIVRDAHEALVHRVRFQHAVALLNTRNVVHGRFSADCHRADSDFRAKYVLTGLAQCAQCGRPFWGNTASRFYSSRRRRAYKAKMYSCKSKSQGPMLKGCNTNQVRKRVLERIVVERVSRWYEGFLSKGGRQAIRLAAIEHCQALAASAGAAPRDGRFARDAKLFQQSALAFLQDVQGQLRDQDASVQRLAFRRCIDRITIDIPRRRLAIWVRRLPILGARAGGLVRIEARLPQDRHQIGLRHRAYSSGRSYDLAWHLRSVPSSTRTLAMKVLGALRAVGPDIRENIAQRYVGLSLGRHFVCMKVQQHRVLLYLKVAPDSLAALLPNMRDVRGLGTQATGGLEISIASVAELKRAMPYVRKAYGLVKARWPGV